MVVLVAVAAVGDAQMKRGRPGEVDVATVMVRRYVSGSAPSGTLVPVRPSTETTVAVAPGTASMVRLLTSSITSPGWKCGEARRLVVHVPHGQLLLLEPVIEDRRAAAVDHDVTHALEENADALRLQRLVGA
jgi:hypothetical protein